MRHLLLNLGHFQTHFFLLLYPTVVLTLQRDGGGSYGDLLLPSTAGFVAFAALTLPAAWAGDRWPKSRLILLLFLGLAAGAALAALASDTVMLAAGLALIGAAAAIYHPVGLAQLAEETSATGRAIGVNGVWGNLGVAAAPLAAALLAETWGWRAAFAVPAVLALLTALLQLREVRSGRVGHRPPESATGAVPRGALARVLLFLFASGLCGGLLFNAMTVALPKMMDDALPGMGRGALSAGAVASAIFAAAAFSQLVSGRLLDRVAARPLAGLLTSGQAASLVLMALATGWLQVLAALALVTLIFAEIPVGDTLVKRVTSPEVRARAYGLVYAVTFGTSVATVPLIAWLYQDGQGFAALLWLLAGAAALLAAAAWNLPRGAGDPPGLRDRLAVA
jgi:MFS family permease